FIEKNESMRSWILQLALFIVVAGNASAQNNENRTILIRNIEQQSSAPIPMSFGITRSDLKIIQSQVPFIQSITPIRFIPGMSVRMGSQTLKARVTGTTANYIFEKNIKVTKGRFLTEKDLIHRHNVVVINSAQAQQLFPDNKVIGKAIRLNTDFFTVVGIVESDQPASLFIPYTTMYSRFGDLSLTTAAGSFSMKRYELSEVELVISINGNLTKAIHIINAILKLRHDQKEFLVQAK
ncbi:MAG: ABC transporter permease, partial [Pirellulaceae bacterium]|nr:ABC transporter permease [Pirellulaceae bacterium]